MFFKKVYIQLVVDFWYIFQELVNLHLMPNYSEITSVSWFLSDNQQMGRELKAAHYKITKPNCILWMREVKRCFRRISKWFPKTFSYDMAIGDAFEKHNTAMFMGVSISSNSPILPM